METMGNLSVSDVVGGLLNGIERGEGIANQKRINAL
jgi:hypothetical protein